LKIWIDILTPKQLLFSEQIIKKLGKKHKFLCTSREYDEVTKLAKIRNFHLVLVGKYGGGDQVAKIEANIDRMGKIFRKIKAFSPDLTISFCSPEAARISFGLGIRHIAFCDSPHATKVMALTLPLIQKLLIPNVIEKKEFSKYGIDKKNIISYKAIDAFVTIQRKTNKKVSLPFKDNKRKNILIRLAEEEASYVSKSTKIIPIIRQIVKEHRKENIVILGRYAKQIQNLQKKFGKKVKIVKMSFDGIHLLNNTDIFIGSGGTMTAESALLEIPTISYNIEPNFIEKYLVKEGLITRETNPNKISNHITKIFGSSNETNQKRVKKIIDKMEDPIQKLTNVIKQ